MKWKDRGYPHLLLITNQRKVWRISEPIYFQFTRYPKPALIIFGTFGAILNQILFFYQKQINLVLIHQKIIIGIAKSKRISLIVSILCHHIWLLMYKWKKCSIMKTCYSSNGILYYSWYGDIGFCCLFSYLSLV